MSTRRIAVTGAQGFLGSAVVEGLLRAGYEVRALLSPAGSPPFPSVRSWVQGDLRDLTVARELVRRCDGVVHCAGRGFPSDPVVRPDALVRENLESTGQLLEAMVVESVPSLIMTSSGGAVYAPASDRIPIPETHPLQFRSPYALAKIATENLADLYRQLYGLQTTVLRIANPYGPGQLGRTRQGFLGVALQKALDGTAMPLWGSLEICKDFLFVEDLWDLFARLVENPTPGTFNVGSGKGITLGEALECIRELTQTELPVELHPSKTSDTDWVVLNSTKIETATGWRATTPLAQGLKKTWNQIRIGKRAA